MERYTIRPNAGVSFEVVHADKNLLVVSKPAGVVTEPGRKHESDSLLNGLFCDYGKALQHLGEQRDWGLLHRLDKDTSGLVLVALTIPAYEHLLEQFKRRQVRKVYAAIVAGRPDPPQGVIQQPIAEVSGSRKRAVIRRDGQQAITAYSLLRSGEGASLVEARPKTGRLHQIRVHMAWLGCPVLGDEMYGGADRSLPRAPRLCLHAGRISFIHPASGHRMELDCPCPADLARCMNRLGLTSDRG